MLIKENSMSDDRHNIINSIHRIIKDAGGDYKKWHVGTCADELKELDIPNANIDSVVFKKAKCTEDAKAVMAYFVYIYETMRAQSIGDENRRTIVYAYQAAD